MNGSPEPRNVHPLPPNPLPANTKGATRLNYCSKFFRRRNYYPSSNTRSNKE
jgi:hypothetical protein